MPARRPRAAPRGRAAPAARGAGEGRALQEAVRAFLAALPLPAGERRRDDLDLAGTPQRVAEAWLEDLVDGYRTDPSELLSRSMPAQGEDLVAVTGIDFHSMCPHHLLPSRGMAHVAYLPAGRVVGFGQIARLVDCFAHRLILEEDLARSIAGALVAHLGVRGAAVVLDAEQACLSVRGEQRPHARAHAQCFLGVLDTDAALQARFLGLITAAGEGPAARGGRAGVRR